MAELFITPTFSDPSNADAHEFNDDLVMRFVKWSDKASKIQMDIIIWGPGYLSDTPVYKKRLQIYDVLQSQGHRPRFSQAFKGVGNSHLNENRDYILAKLAHISVNYRRQRRRLWDNAPGRRALAGVS